ncbi:MAG: protein YgfX [Methylophaga sp.]|nr:protein YgfX [Methylophaga sp.]
MSENVFNIQIKASRQLGYLLMLIHMLAFLAVWLANLPVQVQLLLIVLWLFSASYYGSDTLQQRKQSELLQYSPLDGWRLSAGNQQLSPIVLQQCFISRPLLIINFRQAGKRRSRLLLTDSADHDSLRKCRILLRQTA